MLMQLKEDVVVEILDNVFSSIESYFNALSYFGYKKNSDVNKLLIYNFLSEMLTGEMRYYITEEDYRNIEKALYCLYGTSCLIPYPKYISDTNLFGKEPDVNSLEPRITEGDSILRFFEESLRFKV